MTDTIKTINDNDLYSATIKVTSRGGDDGVTMTFEVSHILDEDFEGEIPASYGVAREIMLGLRRQATMYAPTEADLEYLNDPNTTDEDKARYILEHTSAQEEAANATIN